VRGAVGCCARASGGGRWSGVRWRNGDSLNKDEIIEMDPSQSTVKKKKEDFLQIFSKKM
jgi:hypothetical protein